MAMDVRVFTVGPVAENCYLFRRDDSDRALIVDPGDEPDKLLEAIEGLGVTLEGILLTPLLTSRAARMNAVAVFVGLLFWGWVWEIWGMLLAVPMLMIVKAVCDRIEDLKPVGELLGD